MWCFHSPYLCINSATVISSSSFGDSGSSAVKLSGNFNGEAPSAFRLLGVHSILRNLRDHNSSAATAPAGTSPTPALSSPLASLKNFWPSIAFWIEAYTSLSPSSHSTFCIGVAAEKGCFETPRHNGGLFRKVAHLYICGSRVVQLGTLLILGSLPQFHLDLLRFVSRWLPFPSNSIILREILAQTSNTTANQVYCLVP